MAEGLTPHRVATCALIRIFSSPPALLDQEFGIPGESSLSRTERHELALFLLEECLKSDSLFEPSLLELESRIQRSRVRGWKSITNTLRAILLHTQTNPDNLFTFMGSLSGILTKGATYSVPPPSEGNPTLLLQSSSALGVYLRLCTCSFEALSFEASCDLLVQVQQYLAATLHQPGRESAAHPQGTPSHNVDEEPRPQGAPPVYPGGRETRGSFMAPLEAKWQGRFSVDSGDAAGDDATWQGRYSVDGGDAMSVDGGSSPLSHPGRRSSFPLMDAVAEGEEGRGNGVEEGQGEEEGEGEGEEEMFSCRGSSFSEGGRQSGEREEEGGKGSDLDLDLLGEDPELDGPLHPLLIQERQRALMGTDNNEEGTTGTGTGAGRGTVMGREVDFLRPPSQLAGFLRGKIRDVQRQGVNAMGREEMKRILESTKRNISQVHALATAVQDATGHHPSAVSSLRRSFDYSAGKSAGAPLAAGLPLPSSQSQHDSTSFPLGRFQTALLAEGAMHLRADRVEAAVVALLEAMHMSQQSRDDVCLVHALMSLCHLLTEVDMGQRGAEAGAGEGRVKGVMQQGERVRGGRDKAGVSHTPVFPPSFSSGSLSQLPGAAAAAMACALGSEDSSPLPTHQQRRQLHLLLHHCMRMAAELHLPSLVAFGQVLWGRFFLGHILEDGASSSGPERYSWKTARSLSPLHVCQSLRLPSHILNECLTSALLIPSGSTPLPVATSSPLSPLVPSADVASSGSIGVRDLSLSLSFQTSRSAGASGPRGAATWQPGIGRAQLMDQKGLVASALLQRASAWETYGCPAMATACALTHLTCFADVASAEDKCCSYVKLLKLAACVRGPTIGMQRLQAVKDTLKGIRSKKCLKVLQSLELQLRQQELASSGRHREALQLCKVAVSFLSPSPGCDTEMKMEVMLRKAYALVGEQQYSGALQLAKSLFTQVHRGDHQHMHARVLLLFSHIHSQSGSAISALPYALSALRLSQCLHSDPLYADSVLAVAELWYAQGKAYAPMALQALFPAMPVLVGHADWELKSRGLMLLVECLLMLGSPELLKEVGEEVLGVMDDVHAALADTGDKQKQRRAWYLDAMVSDVLGKNERREAAAENFLAMST